MKKTSFKVGATYKTQDGADTLVVYVDESMIVGVITPENGLRQAFCWRETGLYADRRLPFMDLVVPEPIVQKLWVDVYRSSETVPGYSVFLAGVAGGEQRDYAGTFPFSFEVPDKE